ncbi:MAG: glutaredoxin 3 [Alphaproteobacteria bacterium]|nr:glutaredoxin 3 [Alphaproteobacteria bacterium]
MTQIRVYTTRWCGYCSAAKRFLTDVKGLTYDEIDVTSDPEARRWLVQTTGQTTVPQIFVGEHAIGGYTDMRALDAAGGFDPLLDDG